MNLTETTRKICHIIELRFTSKSTISTYRNCYFRFIKDNSRVYRMTKIQIEKYLIKFRKQFSISYHNQMVSMLKILYPEVLKQNEKVKDLSMIKESKKAISIIHPIDFWSAYNSTKNIKHKAILLTLITTGVRSNELLSIKLSDIDRHNQRIRINKGKGGDGRFVHLEKMLLGLLEEYYFIHKPCVYLFEGQTKSEKYSKTSLSKVVKKYNSNWHPHLFRHTYFTSLAQNGFNPFFAMNVAGHKSIRSQTQYIHFSPDLMNNIPSIGKNFRKAV